MASYNCLRAFGRADALKMIDSHQPDLVLTDLHLPDGNGIEVIRHARTRLPETPVIMMTAYHSPEALSAANEAGVTGYLRKPFAMAELGQTVEAALAALCLGGPL